MKLNLVSAVYLLYVYKKAGSTHFLSRIQIKFAGFQNPGLCK